MPQTSEGQDSTYRPVGASGTRVPYQPDYPLEPNPYLRSPLPSAGPSADALRQYFNDALVPQSRLVPPPTVTAGGSSTSIIQSNVISAGVQALNKSSGNISLVAGNNITLSQMSSTITIIGGAGGGGGGSFSFNGSTNSVSLVAGAGLGSAVNLSTITLSVTAVGTNFTLNATTGSVSIAAGAGIGIGQAASTITISASVQTASVTASVAGNTLSLASVTGTYANSLVVSAMGIISAAMSTSGNTLILSASTPSVTNYSTITATMTGNTLGALSTTATIANSFSLSGAGIVSVGASGGTITISASTAASANVVSSLNASTGQISISAGAGIGIGQAASTITISANVQTSSVSMSASGNTTVSLTGTFSNAIAISGAGIVSVGVGAGSITISATTPAVTNYSTITATMAGNTLGIASTTLSIGNGFSLSGDGNVSVGAAAGTATISASLLTTIASVVGGATSGTANTASSTAFGLVAGSNITLSQLSTSPNITIIGPSPVGGAGFTLNATSSSVSISAGVGIGIGQALSTITISASNQTSNLPARVSYTENFPLAEAGPVTIATLASTGTTAASATNNPFGSSMSLQRIFLPAVMSLTEVDLAFGISFPATSAGQGSMSQTFELFSFGNSTSLASVLSASRATSWTTGTSTSGTASTLQQGWQNYQVQPFTFAASSLSAGEYVAAHLFSWAAANTSWTVSVFGAQALSSLTGISAAFGTGSHFTSSASLTGSIATATASVNVLSNVGTLALPVVEFVQFTNLSSTSYTTKSSTVASSVALSVTSTQIAAFTTNPTSAAALSSGGLSAISVLSTGGLSSASAITAATTGTIGSLTTYNFGYNGTFGMTTSSTQGSYVSGPFLEGIFATGSGAVSIALSSTAALVTGSIALIQPWFAMAGS